MILELKAKASELRTELAATKTELGELAEHTEAQSSRMGGAFNKAAGYGKTLAIGLGGAAVAVGGFAVEAATSAEVVDAKLRVAIKNAGGSMEELEPKIDATDARLRKLGFTNDDTNAALASLTTALKDPQKALDAMGVATDLARAKNIPLSDSAMLVAKAMEGQTRPLKQLGIDLPTYTGGAQNVKLANQSLATAQLTLNHILEKYPDAANKASKAHQAYETAALAVKDAQDRVNSTTHAGAAIMQAIEGRVKGAASAYGDTLKGKVASAKAGLENMAEVLGKKLIPVIDSAIGWAQKFVGWLGDHTPVLYTLAAVIGTVVVAAITAYIAKLVKAGVESAVQFAKMVASGAAWVAEQSASIAESVALWAMYAAQGIGRAVAAAATGFASMIASAAGWIATQAVQLAQSAAGFVAWAAEHAIMAASFIAENIAMAASATAAFIAENAATLGIVAAIGLILAGIVWLATHWKEAWGAITAAAKWAYDNVIKPVADWIMNNAIKPIWSAIQTLGSIWSRVWGAIAAVAKSIAGAVAASLGAIVGAIKTVIGWVQTAIGWFTSLWENADHSTSASQRAINEAAKVPTAASINFGGSLIGGNLGSYVQHHDVGGWITGPKGSPQPSIDHGGEYMLSLDMLAGRQPIDPRVKAAVQGSGPSMSQQALTGGPATPVAAGAPQVTVIAQTNASAKRIASEVGWQLRAMA